MQVFDRTLFIAQTQRLVLVFKFEIWRHLPLYKCIACKQPSDAQKNAPNLIGVNNESSIIKSLNVLFPSQCF